MPTKLQLEAVAYMAQRWRHEHMAGESPDGSIEVDLDHLLPLIAREAERHGKANAGDWWGEILHNLPDDHHAIVEIVDDHLQDLEMESSDTTFRGLEEIQAAYQRVRLQAEKDAIQEILDTLEG